MQAKRDEAYLTQVKYFYDVNAGEASHLDEICLNSYKRPFGKHRTAINFLLNHNCAL